MALSTNEYLEQVLKTTFGYDAKATTAWHILNAPPCLHTSLRGYRQEAAVYCRRRPRAVRTRFRVNHTAPSNMTNLDLRMERLKQNLSPKY